MKAIEHKIIIFTGKVNSGKTTYISNIILNKVNQNISPIRGILSLGEFSEDGKKSYYLYNIETKEKKYLAGEKLIPANINMGKFYFSEETFLWGNEILKQLGNYQSGVIIDEIGFLELNEGGFYSGLTALLKNPPKTLILIIRESLVDKVIKKFGLTEYLIYRIGQNTNEWWTAL